MKYELTDNKITYNRKTLYQIKALISFGNVSKGDLGGYVEKEENLSQKGDCWVSGNAQVFDDAQVFGDAQVFDNAWVFGDASVSDNAWVFGDASVYGDAQVYGDAEVYGNAKVYGDAEVYGNARLLAKLSYTKGWFIGGDNTAKITDITDKTASCVWQTQYVLGDYEINELQEDKSKRTIDDILAQLSEEDKEVIQQALNK